MEAATYKLRPLQQMKFWMLLDAQDMIYVFYKMMKITLDEVR